MADDQMPPRCGDLVLHRPSGEHWIVAWADPATNELAPAGWPDGIARLSDCKVRRRCSEDQHRLSVERWRKSAPDDGRRSRVLRMYGTDGERGAR